MSNNSDQAIAYYVERLPYQYRKPAAQATIAILANLGVADLLALQVQDAYNPANALGVQLDVIGKYVGLPRNIGEAAPLPYFGFVRYSGVGDNDNGFTSYLSGINAGVLFFRYSYQGTRNTALTDDAYRFMLGLKIVSNSSDGTLYSIQKLLRDVLPGLVTLVDNQDMTLTYNISLSAPVSPAVITPWLPRPMGVGVNTTTFVNLGANGGADDVVTGDGDNIVINNP
jgi:hypothetical protein